KSHPSSNLPQRCCAISMFSKRLERDIRIGPVSLDERVELIHVTKSPRHISLEASPPSTVNAWGAGRELLPVVGFRPDPSDRLPARPAISSCYPARHEDPAPVGAPGAR